MFDRQIVDALPQRELTEKLVADLEDHDRIDRAVVEILSDGHSYADGKFRENMVEIFWIAMNGTAHVFEFKREGWINQGSFEIEEVDDPHTAVADLVDY